MIKELDINILMYAKRVREVLSHIRKGRTQYLPKANGEPLAMLLSLDEVEQRKKAKRKPGKTCFR